MSNFQELIDSYPRIFKGEAPRISGYVRAGWHPILMSLFSEIDDALNDAQADALSIVQIKEKFGGLRVYVSDGAHSELTADLHLPEGRVRVSVPTGAQPRPEALSEVYRLIRLAEVRASETCEWCGEPGELRHGCYVQTLCDRHELDRLAGRRAEDLGFD